MPVCGRGSPFPPGGASPDPPSPPSALPLPEALGGCGGLGAALPPGGLIRQHRNPRSPHWGKNTAWVVTGGQLGCDGGVTAHTRGRGGREAFWGSPPPAASAAAAEAPVARAGLSTHGCCCGTPPPTLPACPSGSQWGGNAGAGGEIPAEGLGRRLGGAGEALTAAAQIRCPGDTSMGHRTPAAPSAGAWGELE